MLTRPRRRYGCAAMEGVTSSQPDPLRAVRLATDRVTASLNERDQAITNLEATGFPRDLVEAASRRGRASRPLRWRPRFVSQSGTVLPRTQREAIEELRRATSAVSNAREMQRNAIRHAAQAGVVLDVLAAEAELALAEVRRITERVPVT